MGYKVHFDKKRNLLRKEKMFSRNSEKQKKGILHEEECPIIIFIPYIIYSINITQQPELLHDGCKKQESNP